VKKGSPTDPSLVKTSTHVKKQQKQQRKHNEVGSPRNHRRHDDRDRRVMVLAESTDAEESQQVLLQSEKCNAKTTKQAGQVVCEHPKSGKAWNKAACKARGCCTWDKKCYFCGDLQHDPGCGGDGKGFVKNAKGTYVKKGSPTDPSLVKTSTHVKKQQKQQRKHNEVGSPRNHRRHDDRDRRSNASDDKDDELSQEDEGETYSESDDSEEGEAEFEEGQGNDDDNDVEMMP